MQVEVIIRDRVYNYTRGQVVTIEDGLFLRALLNGKKAEVLNPPDWYPGKEDENGSESSNQQISDSEPSEQFSKNSKGTRKKSSISTGEGEGTSSERYGGSSELSILREDD